MTQLGFYINQSLCSGCKACTVSCKDKNNLDVGINYRRVYSYEEGNYMQTPGQAIVSNIKSFYFSISCNHCLLPACVEICPTKAITKRALDGVVIIDLETCAGTQFCIKACPYGSPQYNPKTFKSNKCDFCLDFQEKGEDPVCVSACPMSAIDYGPIEELYKKYGKINETKGMPSSSITHPNLVITPHRDAFM